MRYLVDESQRERKEEIEKPTGNPWEDEYGTNSDCNINRGKIFWKTLQWRWFILRKIIDTIFPKKTQKTQKTVQWMVFPFNDMLINIEYFFTLYNSRWYLINS